MEHGEPPDARSIHADRTTPLPAGWAVDRKENPKAVKRVISFPGQFNERVNPFTRRVEETCEAIVGDVRTRGGLVVTIGFRINASQRENGSRVDTVFSIVFEPIYRHASRVQELLHEIIIDDALEELARKYRGAYKRIIDKAPTVEMAPLLLGYALHSPHETPGRNGERGQNHRDFGGAGGFHT